MGKLIDLNITDTVCVWCLAEAKAEAEGRTAFSVSTAGKALCVKHNELRLEEMMD